MLADLDVDSDRLAALCRRLGIVRLELFGSRARGDARVDSDVDLMATFAPDRTPGLEFFGMADEFAALLGHPVDLVTRSAVEALPNRYKREHILASTRPLYAATT